MKKIDMLTKELCNEFTWTISNKEKVHKSVINGRKTLTFGTEVDHIYIGKTFEFVDSESRKTKYLTLIGMAKQDPAYHSDANSLEIVPDSLVEKAVENAYVNPILSIVTDVKVSYEDFYKLCGFIESMQKFEFVLTDDEKTANK